VENFSQQEKAAFEGDFSGKLVKKTFKT